MKNKSILSLAISLTLLTAGTAQADWGGRHDDYRPRSQEYRHHHAYDRGSSWAGPAALLAITGLAIGAVAYNQANATPAYVMQPRPVQPPPDSGSWYFCESSGQYYPYTRFCPEGWQAVMPPR